MTTPSRSLRSLELSKKHTPKIVSAALVRNAHLKPSASLGIYSFFSSVIVVIFLFSQSNTSIGAYIGSHHSAFLRHNKKKQRSEALKKNTVGKHCALEKNKKNKK